MGTQVISSFGDALNSRFISAKKHEMGAQSECVKLNEELLPKAEYVTNNLSITSIHIDLGISPDIKNPLSNKGLKLFTGQFQGRTFHSCSSDPSTFLGPEWV